MRCDLCGPQPPLPKLIDRNGGHDDQSHDHVLDRVRQAKLSTSGRNGSHQRRSGQCTQHRPAAAAQAGSANDHCRNHAQLKSHPGGRIALAQLGEVIDPCNANEEAGQRIYGQLYSADIDAAQPRGGFVRADRKDVPARAR